MANGVQTDKVSNDCQNDDNNVIPLCSLPLSQLGLYDSQYADNPLPLPSMSHPLDSIFSDPLSMSDASAPRLQHSDKSAVAQLG